jgi:neutral ceramidase
MPFTLARICFLLCVLAATAQGGELHVGAAAISITPAPGAPMAGYYSARSAEGVDDDLFAKALVIEQDGAKAAMVVCDLISMPREVAEAARKLIEQETGLPPERVMISATHTHTGPVLPTGSSRDPAEEGSADAARRYVASLPGLIAKSVSAAHGALRPARALVGVGREEHLSFNRRFVMKDGSVGWNPGKKNPNIVKPAGPIDPDVPVVYFETPDGKPVATYVNFAMHLDTVGGLRVSADYPFTLATILSELKGPEMVTLFSIGCAGDINHIDVSSADGQQGPGEAKRIGTVLAGEVIKTSARLRPVTTSAPRGRRKVVQLALAPINPDDVETARKTATTFGKNAPTFLERVHAYKILDVHARGGEPLEAEVQVISLGDDLAFVALPGEIFVELGLSVKRQSPFRHTIIAELANGSVGYVPTRRAYAEGNYEAVSARCAAGAGEQIVEAAVRLLREMRAGEEKE